MSQLAFLTNYYVGSPAPLSPEYVAFRDRVVADGGSISAAGKAQAALSFVAANAALQPVQWLDSRFGTKTAQGLPPKWYSILGAPADAQQTIYGNAQLGTDLLLDSPVWNNGAFDGGTMPQLLPAESYTIGMRYYHPAGGNDGFYWGNRYGSPGGYGWSLMVDTLWQSYAYGYNSTISFGLPRNVWSWVWLVKNGPVVTLYNEANAVLGSVTMEVEILEIPFGIGGGTDSTGISTGLRYQTVVRFASSLTAAERVAVQAI